MRKWIAIGREEGWSAKEIAGRARVDPKTVRRWIARFRAESVSLTSPDFEEAAFAELVERADTNACRVEVVIPGKRRVVIDGDTIVQAWRHTSSFEEPEAARRCRNATRKMICEHYKPGDPKGC